MLWRSWRSVPLHLAETFHPLREVQTRASQLKTSLKCMESKLYFREGAAGPLS
uniref:Uncharacterized protein n=1 Tax=Esox lucius TaxID=8010 RepID=A0AAY5KKA4_ESOLU